jgi:hypothetical protein
MLLKSGENYCTNTLTIIWRSCANKIRKLHHLQSCQQTRQGKASQQRGSRGCKTAAISMHLESNRDGLDRGKGLNFRETKHSNLVTSSTLSFTRQITSQRWQGDTDHVVKETECRCSVASPRTWSGRPGMDTGVVETRSNSRPLCSDTGSHREGTRQGLHYYRREVNGRINRCIIIILILLAQLK